MKRLSILVTNLLLVAAGYAQQADATDEDLAEEPPRYTVEVIIFSYAEDISVGTEVFLPEIIAQPVDEETNELTDEDREGEVETEMDDDELRLIYPFAYLLLDQDEFTLADAWSRFELLDAYEPLMHFGWTQPTIPEDQTPTLGLGRFGDVPIGLEGSLKLFRSRYLHLDVDVSLAAPEPAADATALDRAFDETVAVFGDARVQNDDILDPYTPQYAPLRYRLAERRIMKNGETRYYDHPKIGVIAKVVRVEQEPVDDSATP